MAVRHARHPWGAGGCAVVGAATYHDPASLAPFFQLASHTALWVPSCGNDNDECWSPLCSDTNDSGKLLPPILQCTQQQQQRVLSVAPYGYRTVCMWLEDGDRIDDIRRLLAIDDSVAFWTKAPPSSSNATNILHIAVRLGRWQCAQALLDAARTLVRRMQDAMPKWDEDWMIGGSDTGSSSSSDYVKGSKDPSVADAQAWTAGHRQFLNANSDDSGLFCPNRAHYMCRD